MLNFFAGLEDRADPWPAHQPHLHWHVLFPADEVQRRLTEPYRGLTNRPGIEPVAPEWVHMTVLHSGPVDDATSAEIEEITQRVRDRAHNHQPFSVMFSPPAVGTVAVECIGRPGQPARDLWATTWQETRAVVGNRWPLRPETYYPHISLGYAGDQAELADRTQMKIWLSDHGHGEVALRATQLSLVAQWHDGRSIMWEALANVPLGDGWE